MQYVRGYSLNPTIRLEDSFSKRVKFGSHYEPVDVEILDTAGSDQFSAMRDMYIGNGDIFLLVYGLIQRRPLMKLVTFTIVSRPLKTRR